MELKEEVRKEVDTTYKYLGKIAKDLVKQHTKEIDDIIRDLINVEIKTDNQLRNDMLKLSCLAYNLAEIKEHANLRADCSTALYKEKQALEFSNVIGTQQQKHQHSVIASLDNQAVQILYNSVAKLFSTKLDETHRVVNTLNGILIGRMSAQKQQRTEMSSTSLETEPEMF